MVAGKAQRWTWNLVVLYYGRAFGLGAQPGFFQGLLGIRADLPQPLVACALSLDSIFGRSASAESSPHPLIFAGLLKTEKRPFLEDKPPYKHWRRGYVDASVGNKSLL